MCRTNLWYTKIAVFALALFCSLAAGSAFAATAGELLQKAIYTEETVGNLDEAMKLYEQVIAKGKAGQEAAAQAQFRLGMCHLKKGNDAAARAAFESLIKNFPNATHLIAEARKHLPSTLKLLPAPWTDGEKMQFSMKLPTGMDIGTMIYLVGSVENEQHGKLDAIQCSTRGFVTINGANSYSQVLARAESFAPIRSRWKHTLLGDATATYADDSVTIDIAGKDTPVVIDFTPPVFDNEQGVELFRRLPLAVGYKSTLSVITTLMGGKVDLPLSVSKVETITTPVGSFECFRMDIGVVNQTFWISNDEHRYVVRFASGGVSADLTSVGQLTTGKAEAVSGENFSLTLPPGWFSYAAKSDSDANKLYLLDPHADVESPVTVRPKTTLKEAEQASSKVWTEAALQEFKSLKTNFSVLEPGLVETKIGGQDSTTVVVEFTEGGKKKRMLGVAVLGDTLAANLWFSTDADKFKQLKPDFDAIVASFHLK